jgi:hypothetical protein
MSGRLDKTGATLRLAWRRGWGQTRNRGAYTNQRSNLSYLGRPTEESRGFKPDLGNPAVRDYRGASGNVTMVEL